MRPPSDDLDLARARRRPFEEAELALVRTVVGHPHWLPEPDEHALRYALNLAHLGRVRAPDGEDVDLEGFLAPFREEVAAVAEPLLLRGGGVDRPAVARLAPHLATHARTWRSRVARAFSGRLPLAALDREVCEKALVLVCGGGGGVSYVSLGGFALLEQYGLVPRLLAGASMGAVLLLFRARRLRYQPAEIEEIVGGLSFRSLFRPLQTESRYGLPGALRLYLRHGLGQLLEGPDGHPLSLGELAIPLVVAVTGLRNGALPQDTSCYEHLLDLHGRAPRPHVVKRMVSEVLSSVSELVRQRDRFARIYLGADPGTRDFDALDAVGFSAALPGVVHYDVLREDERMHALLAELFQRHDLFRLVDGGISDNVPARAAWAQVQAGALGTRNAFVLAFDGFGPKLSQPLWLGLERLVQQNVARNRPFIHLHKSFQQVLSPLDVLPSVPLLRRAVQLGKAQLVGDMPLVARLCRPFPALEGRG